MKKKLLLSILGMAATSAFGEGFVILDNYDATGGLVTYGPGIPANGVSGPLGTLGTGLLSGWTVGLYYVLGTPSISDPPNTTVPIAPLTLATGLGATASVYDSTGVPGEFFSQYPYAVPGGSPGGTVTLELIFYDTADGSYASAHYRAHSAPFVITMQAEFAIPPTAYVGPAFSTFGESPLPPPPPPPPPYPEPSTFALAGLGACLWLARVRRKNF